MAITGQDGGLLASKRVVFVLVLLGVGLAVFAGAGTALAVDSSPAQDGSPGPRGPDSTTVISNGVENETADDGERPDSFVPVNTGATVVYDFRSDDRLDSDGNASVSGGLEREFEGTPLMKVPESHDKRERVEKPWDTLTRHETVVQVQMTLQNGNMSSCTGTIVGEYHVLTAGHCVQFSAFDGWVDEVSVVPMIDTQEGTVVEPYGKADVRIARTYQAWLDHETNVPEHDFALLTLDRSIGQPDATTVMEWGAYPANDPVYTQDTVFNHGYPGTPPHGPFPSLWEDQGEGLGHYFNDGTFQADIKVSGGHSGGPLFHSTSAGNNEQIGVAAYKLGRTTMGPRVSFKKGGDLSDWTNATQYVGPPDDKPEFVFESTAYTGEDRDFFEVDPVAGIVPGETEITFEHAVRNVGTVQGTNEINITLREAVGGSCDEADPAFHTESVAAPSAFDSTNVSFTTTLPSDVSSDSVPVCLTIESGVDEFDDRDPSHNVSAIRSLDVVTGPDVESSLGKADADPGQTVEVTFDVMPENDPEADIAGYEVEIEYDADVLSFIDAEGEDLSAPIVGEPEDGTLIAVADQLTGEPVPLTVATFTFEVAGGVDDVYGDVSFVPGESSLTNENIEDVSTIFEDGYVEVGNPPPRFVPPFPVGDSNADGEISVRDSVLIKQHLVGMEPDPFHPMVADVNRNGEVSVRDSVLIKQYLVGMIDNGTLVASNLSVDAGSGLVNVDLDNVGGMGVLQEVELRIADTESGLGDEDAIVETRNVELTQDAGLVVQFDVPADQLSQGDWVGIYTDDDEETTQVT